MSREYFRNWKAFLVVVLSMCTTINLNIRNKLKKKRERGFYRHPPPSSYTVIDFSNFLKAVSNSIQTEEILLKCDISFRDVYFKLISLKSIPCIAICSHRYWILHDNKRKTKWRMENQSPSNLKTNKQTNSTYTTFTLQRIWIYYILIVTIGMEVQKLI